jgi:hypothetical protein
VRERVHVEGAQALGAGGPGVAGDRREGLDDRGVLLIIEELLPTTEIGLDRLRIDVGVGARGRRGQQQGQEEDQRASH